MQSSQGKGAQKQDSELETALLQLPGVLSEEEASHLATPVQEVQVYHIYAHWLVVQSVSICGPRIVNTVCFLVVSLTPLAPAILFPSFHKIPWVQPNV